MLHYINILSQTNAKQLMSIVSMLPNMKLIAMLDQVVVVQALLSPECGVMDNVVHQKILETHVTILNVVIILGLLLVKNNLHFIMRYHHLIQIIKSMSVIKTHFLIFLEQILLVLQHLVPIHSVLLMHQVIWR